MANEAKSNEKPKVPQDDAPPTNTQETSGLSAKDQEEVRNTYNFANKKINFRKSPNPRPNPLSKFASYTYQITLYMITPDAYDAFVLSGRQNINALSPVALGTNTTSGVYIVAQSGGINDTSSRRLPEMNFDYYIDDLKIVSKISGKTTGTAAFTTDINFTITEPYGFSFTTKLNAAQKAILQNSKIKNFDKIPSALLQFFVLGIKFQGYDENGKIITPQTIFSQDTRTILPSANGVYERFYDFKLTELKYKLGGGATVYSCKGSILPNKIGLGTKFSTISDSLTISETNVENAIRSLLKSFNEKEQNQVNAKNCEIANQYDVRFIGENNKEISGAKLKSPADLQKLKTAMANFSYLEDSGEAVAARASSVDLVKQNISFNKGTSLPLAIQTIIAQSDYLEKALKVIYKTNKEPNPKTKQPGEVVKEEPLNVKWYNCGVEVKCLGFDTKKQDWAYKITYVIQPYETPSTFSAFTKSTKYYGPVKRYKYWFTGQNSEILSYEQTLNTNYYVINFTGNATGQGTGGALSVPSVLGQPQNEVFQGGPQPTQQATNNYITNLYDPESLQKAKIKILGDPDFLVKEVPESINQVYNQFYDANGFTINAAGGEVFIEVDFNEAIDYNNNNGTMDINESILLYPYPTDIAKYVEGVSFRVLEVTSTFSKGTFTQDLNVVVNNFPSIPRDSDTRETPVTQSTVTDVRKDPANSSLGTFSRTGIAPSNIQGGRGTIIPPTARPNSIDDNQPDLPGRAVPDAGNIGDNPAA